MRKYLETACPELDGNLDAALALGHSPSTGDFNMTALAVRTSRYQNGVSGIHGGVSAKVCAELWPQIDPDENPLRYITNGVHVPTFLADAWHRAFDDYLGPGWAQRLRDQECWKGVHNIPDSQFWSVHQHLKSEMLHLVCHRIRTQHSRNHGHAEHIDRSLKPTHPATPTEQTIVHAWRFVTDTRSPLMFHRIGCSRETISYIYITD